MNKQIHLMTSMTVCGLTFAYAVLFSIAGSAQSQSNEELPIADTIKIPENKRKLVLVNSVEKYVRINRILLSGNKRTRKGIVLRELRLREGNVITESDLDYVIQKDQQKLFNLHLFNTVTIRPIPQDTAVVDLLIEMEERWYTFPVPRFQLSDRNFNEWWQNYNHDWRRVNYGLKLYQYNLFGLNQTLLLKAQLGFQKNIQLLYKIPYINRKQTGGLIFELNYVNGKSISDSTIDHKLHFIKSRDILKTTRGIGLTYTYRRNFYLQHLLKYEYRYSTIADTILEVNPNYFGEAMKRQEFDALTYEVSSDHTDVAAYPLKGYSLLFGAQRYGIARRQDVEKTSVYLKLAGFLDLTRNFYLSDLFYVFWSNPDHLPYSNYSTMGYDKIFVRGYEIYVIEGPRYILNKTTLKKKIFSRNWHLNNWSLKQFNYLPIAIYLKTYADWGYVDNYSAYEDANVNNSLSNKLLSGGGFGVDVVTGYDLAIRFEYTFTPDTKGFFLHFKKEF